MNLTGSCGQQQRLRGWSRMVVKQFQDGGRPFFDNQYIAISQWLVIRIYMKFCTQQHILNWMNVTWSKMQKLHWTDSEFDRTYFLLMISWSRAVRFESFFGILVTKGIGHWQVFSGFHLTYLMQLFYHGWESVVYHEFSLKLPIFPMPAQWHSALRTIKLFYYKLIYLLIDCDY